mgnify:CR=1 FL=1
MLRYVVDIVMSTSHHLTTTTSFHLTISPQQLHFATQQLGEKINARSTDKQIEKVLRSEVKDAIDNSYNVLRSRIDRFGVAQPNIQKLEGSNGRIMVEMPGVKEPERVRKLLQKSPTCVEFRNRQTTKSLESSGLRNAVLRRTKRSAIICPAREIHKSE